MMHDITEEVPVTASSTFDTDQVPELKGKGLGDKVTLLVEGKITRVDETESRISYTVAFKRVGMQKQDVDNRKNFMKMLKGEAEKTKEDYSEDITRVPGQNSKAHRFNQQLGEEK